MKSRDQTADQTLASERKCVDFTESELMATVTSLLRSGMDLESEDEYGIRERATDFQTAFAKDTEVMTQLYKANVNRVNELGQTVASIVHEPWLSTTSSAHSAKGLPEAKLNDATNASTGLELAVYSKINEDDIYDALEDEEYMSELATSTRVAKRMTQAISKMLVFENPGWKSKFDESDYLLDALLAAVQVVLFSPPEELMQSKPAFEKLWPPLIVKADRDWYMKDEKVKAILANSAGEMNALRKAVKLFFHMTAHSSV